MSVIVKFPMTEEERIKRQRYERLIRNSRVESGYTIRGEIQFLVRKKVYIWLALAVFLIALAAYLEP